MEKIPTVYILSNRPYGTLYVGVTSNLQKRIDEHKSDLLPGFSKEYRLHTLIWYEIHPTIINAIRREKALKKWNRSWKIRLIRKMNPEWQDLSSQILSGGPRQNPRGMT